MRDSVTIPTNTSRLSSFLCRLTPEAGLRPSDQNFYTLRGGKAFLRGSLWIAIRPKNGSSSPRIRKIAAETDSPQTTSDAKVTALGGAISEKIVIQSSSTAKKGEGYRTAKMRKQEQSRFRKF